MTLTHAEITYMCVHVLESRDEADFYRKMDQYIAEKGMEDFKQLVKKLKRKSLGLTLTETETLYQNMYA